MRDKRQKSPSARIRQRRKHVIPTGKMIESLEFFKPSIRVSADETSSKDLDFVFSTMGQVVEVEGVERNFRHINVEGGDVTHVMMIAYRPDFREEFIVRWNFDFYRPAKATEIIAQAVKYHVFGCRRLGDILLEGAKA